MLRLGREPWRVRVVPNLYPAFERQEVVIHAPEHVRSFAELDDEQVALVAEAWSRRIHEEGGSVLAIVNEGRIAGASLPHSHSQLVWAELPTEDVRRLGDLAEAHPIAERNGVVAAVHPFGAAPYECLTVPSAGGGELADHLLLLRDLVSRLQAIEGERPWNAWLHLEQVPHIHFVPRLTAVASLELGAGLYINVVPPDEAARALSRGRL